MSTIQTQYNLVHLDSGLSAGGVFQKATAENTFTSSVLEVTTTYETVTLGDVTTPQLVFIKHVGGDPVRIGFSDASYPMRVGPLDNDNGEMCVLRLDVEGIKEISTAETVADVAGSLNDKYFTLADRAGEVKVVITNDGVTALTSTGRVVVVTIVDDDVAADVALAIVAAFADDAELAVSAVDNLVTFTDKHTGTRTNIATGDSGFTVATTQAGAASPVIHLKSTGTSQVLVAVAPN